MSARRKFCMTCHRDAPCYVHLPSPNNHGSYFLRADKNYPAIFRITKFDSPDCGKWMVCPDEEDVPFSDGKIKVFDSPEAALSFLRKMVERSRV